MTCLNKGWAFISLGLLIMALDAYGAITIVPNNTAVLMGTSRVVISCASDIGYSAISWSYFPVGGSTVVDISFAGTSVIAAQTQYYAAEQSGSQQINLIVLNATTARAGTYICSQLASQVTAQLIVINAEPVCSMTPNAPTELMYNQTVQMSCSISYTANTSYVAVNMIWSKDDPPISVNSPEPRTNTSTAVSAITVTPGSFTPFPIYRCNASFRITDNSSSGSTKNPPDYFKLMPLFNSSISVIYLTPANESAITGARSGDSVYLGTNVICNVDANPPANYSWLDVTYGNTTNSSSIQIWHAGDYQCTAWNKAASTSVAIKNVTTRTTTTASTTTPTTTPTTTVTSRSTSRSSPSGSDRTASAGQDSSTGGLTDPQKNIIIGVVVGVGGALLIGAIIVIVCCCLKNKKNKLDKYANEGRTPSGKPPPYDDGRHGPPPHHHHGSANPDLVNEGYRLDEYPLPQQYTLHNDPRQSRPYVVDDEGLNYAQIQLDNNPRSRQPLQMKDETNYTDVRLA